MILVDTSVWAQHIDHAVDALGVLLEADEVCCHPFIIGEIALGNLRRRDAVLGDFQLLHQATVASHAEVLGFIEQYKLFGRGVGWVDVHLLAAARLTEDTLLWTFDKRLGTVATQLGIAYRPDT